MRPTLEPDPVERDQSPAGLDLPLAGIVLLASGLVLAAPAVGRAGAPNLALVLAALAGLLGTASFLVALVHTMRCAGDPARREETA